MCVGRGGDRTHPLPSSLEDGHTLCASYREGKGYVYDYIMFAHLVGDDLMLWV